MKGDDSLPILSPTVHPSSSSSTTIITSPAAASSVRKDGSADLGLLGRGRYKFWAFSAILLLAFWSMLTSTVTLRWSAGNLNHFSDRLDFPIHDDLDVLEMEDREKMVKHMWDLYTNSKQIKLPRFWQQAFEAAYEELTGEDTEVREAAFSEIVKMSPRFVKLDSPPHFSTSSIPRELSRKPASVAQSDELSKD